MFPTKTGKGKEELMNGRMWVGSWWLAGCHLGGRFFQAPESTYLQPAIGCYQSTWESLYQPHPWCCRTG